MPVAGDIYAGLHQNWEQIVAAALREEADGIGLSVLSGAHMTQFSMVLKLLAARGARDIVVFRGGIVPEEDIRDLARPATAAADAGSEAGRLMNPALES